MKRSLPFCSTLVLCLLTTLASARQADVGSAAPSWRELEWVSGDPSAQATGKPVVLEFWATWCPPCIEAMPHINSLADRYRDRLLFVSVDYDEKRKTVESFLRKKEMKTFVGIDRGRKLVEAYAVRAVPTTILIGGDGTIQWRGRPAALTEALLDQFLATGTMPPPKYPKGHELYSFSLHTAKTEDVSVGFEEEGRLYWAFTTFTADAIIQQLLSFYADETTRVRIEGKAPTILLDFSFHADSSLSKSFVIQDVADRIGAMFGARIDRRTERRKTYTLLCPDSTRLSKGAERFGELEEYDTDTAWHRKGVRLMQVAMQLEAGYDVPVFCRSAIREGYDLTIPRGDFAAARRHLEEKYGIVLKEEEREMQYITVTFPEDVVRVVGK